MSVEYIFHFSEENYSINTPIHLIIILSYLSYYCYMAPNNPSNPRPTNMSSFNQFFASTAAPQQRAPSSGTTLPLSASFREVLVGKDKHAIQLPVLPPSSEAKHLCQFCFRQFRSLLLQHEDDHTSSELTTVIQQEIPIDSIQESFFSAQAVRKQILGAPFQVQHLEFLGLLDSAGDQVVIGAYIADRFLWNF